MIKSSKIITAAAVLLATLASGAAAAVDVEVDYLGGNHTMVRVPATGKYLLMPVQEKEGDAAITLLVDGHAAKTFNVRLAKSRVDYTVPLDIEEYAGRDLILDVSTFQDRSTVRDVKDDICWTNFAVSDTFDTANREKFRPLYHHTPLYGWMNDPNGMVYVDGEWQLCYQWNPYGSKWQNMNWGQSVSRDLIHWTHKTRPVIEPNGLGMVFSGSAAIDSTGSAGFGRNAVVAMYTSAAASQIQSLAHSEDGGNTYIIYPGNPVITQETEARDPNFFWDKEKRQWVLLLAHALDHEMLVYTSPDMKDWTLRSSFGKGLGAQGGVWECPDLFELPVEGSGESKWVLLCNINPGGPFGGSATQYFTGDFDGTVFTPDLDADGNVPTKWMDFGKDNYASVSFSDAPSGRRTIIGWMSNWQYAAEVPTTQFRSANTLPRDLSLFRGADGQLYLASVPSPEIDAIRGAVVASARRARISSRPKSYALPRTGDGACEIEAELDCGSGATVSLTLSNSLGEDLVVAYDRNADTFSVDRRRSGIVDFSDEFPAVTVAPAFSESGKVSLRIFVDRTSVELFGNGGRSVMTNLVFPNQPYTTLSVRSEGARSKIENLKIYSVDL